MHTDAGSQVLLITVGTTKRTKKKDLYFYNLSHGKKKKDWEDNARHSQREIKSLIYVGYEAAVGVLHGHISDLTSLRKPHIQSHVINVAVQSLHHCLYSTDLQ